MEPLRGACEPFMSLWLNGDLILLLKDRKEPAFTGTPDCPFTSMSDIRYSPTSMSAQPPPPFKLNKEWVQDAIKSATRDSSITFDPPAYQVTPLLSRIPVFSSSLTANRWSWSSLTRSRMTSYAAPTRSHNLVLVVNKR